MDNAEATEVVEDAPIADEVEQGNWRQEAGLEGNPQFEKFESIGDLAKSYSELESKIGSSIRFPTKEAGEEDIAKFNAQMMERGYHRAPDPDNPDAVRDVQKLIGMPSEAKGYEFSEVEGYDGDPESEGEFKSLAYEIGLTRDQADKIHSWLGGNIANSVAEQNNTIEESMKGLKGEWGQAFDNKVANARNAAHMLEERIPGISTYFDSMAENGQDANMIRLMDAFAEITGESGAKLPAGVQDVMTPTEARQRIDDAQMNPDHWWHLDPDQLTDHQRNQRVEWLKAAYGG